MARSGPLGRATAKVHCVADRETDPTLVDFQTEDEIVRVIDGNEASGDGRLRRRAPGPLTAATGCSSNAFRNGGYGAVRPGRCRAHGRKTSRNNHRGASPHIGASERKARCLNQNLRHPGTRVGPGCGCDPPATA